GGGTLRSDGALIAGAALPVPGAPRDLAQDVRSLRVSDQRGSGSLFAARQARDARSFVRAAGSLSKEAAHALAHQEDADGREHEGSAGALPRVLAGISFERLLPQGARDDRGLCGPYRR